MVACTTTTAAASFVLENANPVLRAISYKSWELTGTRCALRPGTCFGPFIAHCGCSWLIYGLGLKFAISGALFFSQAVGVRLGSRPGQGEGFTGEA
jgi:hypothetical protein